MSVRKLSELDKSDILNLYRLPAETTSTLASRYGVSNSTISRLLKSRLSEEDYEALIQQKRATRTQSSDSLSESESESEIEDQLRETSQSQPVTEESPVIVSEESSEASFESVQNSERRRRKRPSAVSQSVTFSPPSIELPPEPVDVQLPLFDLSVSPAQTNSSAQLEESEDSAQLEERKNRYNTEASVLEEMLGEDLDDDLDEDADLDDSDEEDEDSDDEDDWEDEALPRVNRLPAEIFSRDRGAKIEVLPLSEASLPKTCYLVVDRAAELIARPLREFSDLGQIPAQEVQQKTLPVFDNHRVARRYSNRAQRVIKIPDGRMLQRTCSHLQAKGITRLLIDGQVYSL